ncbi:hypothetical protein RYX36_031328, partial [Vicia faba]
MTSKKKILTIEDLIESVGLGYDLTNDLKLKSYKFDSRLIAIDHHDLQIVQLPSRVSILMSEKFNQEVSLSGVWQRDAANTKSLAFDRVL